MLILVFLSIVLLLPASGWAATYVQGKICTLSVSASSTMTCAFDSNTTAGNVIVGSAMYATGTVTGMTFSDNQSGVYATTQSQLSAPSATAGGALGVGTVGTAGATTVTMTYTNSEQPDYHGLCLLEYSGVNTTTPVDVSASSSAASPTTATDAVTSGAAVTTADGERIVGAHWHVQNFNVSPIVAGTGFTNRVHREGGAVFPAICEDLVQTTQGSIAATATIPAANNDVVSFMVALKEAVAALRSSTRMIPGIGN